jgi:hypothetical protein
MGSLIKFNDTLKIKTGFPEKLELGGEYSFSLDDRRVFHLTPVRVFLVEEISGKWNFRGHAQILEFTVNALTNKTSGRFMVSKVYREEERKLINKLESPEGKAYEGS